MARGHHEIVYSLCPLKVAHVTIKYCNHTQFYVGLCIFIGSVLDLLNSVYYTR